MKCIKHKRREAVAVCLHCGVGICEACLKAARKNVDDARRDSRCGHEAAATFRRLHQLHEQLKLAAAAQIAFGFTTAFFFLGIAVVFLMKDEWATSVLTGFIAIACLIVVVRWWLRECKLDHA